MQVWHGEAPAAVAAFERAQVLATVRGVLLRQYTAEGYRGFALIEAGRAREGAAALVRALDMAGQLRLQFMVAMSSSWLAEAPMQSGEFDSARDLARQAGQLAKQPNEPWARSVDRRRTGQAPAFPTAHGPHTRKPA